MMPDFHKYDDLVAQLRNAEDTLDLEAAKAIEELVAAAYNSWESSLGADL